MIEEGSGATEKDGTGMGGKK
jgi:hypothetical protein